MGFYEPFEVLIRFVDEVTADNLIDMQEDYLNQLRTMFAACTKFKSAAE